MHINQMYMNQVRLLVTDFDKSFGFYHDILGLELAFGEASSGYAEFLTGADTSAVAIMDKTFLSEGAYAGAGINDAFNLTFTVNSVDAVYQDLSEKGVEFINSPTTREEMAGRVAHFRDPDGNLIELYELLDAAS